MGRQDLPQHGDLFDAASGPCSGGGTTAGGFLSSATWSAKFSAECAWNNCGKVLIEPHGFGKTAIVCAVVGRDFGERWAQWPKERRPVVEEEIFRQEEVVDEGLAGLEEVVEKGLAQWLVEGGAQWPKSSKKEVVSENSAKRRRKTVNEKSKASVAKTAAGAAAPEGAGGSKRTHSKNPAGRFALPKTTIVFVPPHLLNHWTDELNRFLPFSSTPRRTDCRYDAKDRLVFPDLLILVIASVSDWNKLTVQQLASCDVLLVAYSVLSSPSYVRRRDELCSRSHCGGTMLSSSPSYVIVEGRCCPAVLATTIALRLLLLPHCAVGVKRRDDVVQS